MQSLIELLDAERDYRLSPDKHYIAIDRVIALIKQHEQPVDEAALSRLMQEALAEKLAIKCSNTLVDTVWAIMPVIRPYLKQQQPVSASVVKLIAENRDALSAGLPYMEGGSFSSVYARRQVKEQISHCEAALAAMQGEKGE